MTGCQKVNEGCTSTKSSEFTRVVRKFIGALIRDMIICDSICDQTSRFYCQNPNSTITQPQPHITLVGLDTKMALHTTPPPPKAR